MRIFNARDAEAFRRAADALRLAAGDACLCCAMPPLFAMPEKLVRALSDQTGSDALLTLWRKSLSAFRRQVKQQTLSLILTDAAVMQMKPGTLRPPLAAFFETDGWSYSREQYLMHMEHLMKLEKQYKNLSVSFRTDLSDSMLLYVKDNSGVILAKTDHPATAFVIRDRTMVCAFWDYLTKR